MRDCSPDRYFPSLDTLEYGCVADDAPFVESFTPRADRAERRPASVFSTIPEIIAEARAGRPFILVDSEDRENEGDLVIPARFASDRIVNFMAKHARGLICLTITPALAQKLQLRPMVEDNNSPHQTAFTVSIEAASGVTTGISAQDRAHTIATAIDPAADHRALVSPGHIFPLVAKHGGVLERPGHTEASVDIARLAGLTPAGVICEIMNDDGTMARLPDLRRFAQLHDLRIGSIESLIAYRQENENQTMIEAAR